MCPEKICPSDYTIVLLPGDENKNGSMLEKNEAVSLQREPMIEAIETNTAVIFSRPSFGAL